eukprot:15449060-Alexandrium_andersonii.AAC.1
MQECLRRQSTGLGCARAWRSTARECTVQGPPSHSASRHAPSNAGRQGVRGHALWHFSIKPCHLQVRYACHAQKQSS